MRLAIVFTVCCAALAAPAFAKLPPLSDAAKAQAAEKAAKTAWSNKVAAHQLCEAQDRAVANYQSNTTRGGTPAPQGERMPACVNPGAYGTAQQEQRPLEASEAHSPPATAIKPPSTTSTQGEIDGKVKN